MLKLRILFGLLVLALVLGGGLYGQDTKNSQDPKDSKDPPTKAKGMLPTYWSKLGLTAKQKQDVYKKQAEYRGRIDALRLQAKELEDKERGELLKLLTDDQRKRLREILDEKAGITPK